MDTPCLVVDLSIVDRNIARFQKLADSAGLKTRPHIKTHKLPFMAKRQIAAGAIGITCQKIGEAEVMADAGIKDILITYNIVGQPKLDRLAALGRRCRLSVTCDNETVAQGLSDRFAGEPDPLPVLIECDTGAGRCGVQSPEAALSLARRIQALPGLQLEGLMTYPPMSGSEQVDQWLATARDLLTTEGLPCPVISTGGTPNIGDLGCFRSATEHRAGTYIYNDRYMIAFGACGEDDCAATVQATVVSRPTADRAIIDAGSKVLSSDLLGLEDYGLIREAPGARIVALAEEHGTIDLAGSGWDPMVGEEISIIPNHVCVVSNLLDAVILRHPDGRLESMPVAARGKVK
ncbi:D-TA family PLP-dependent enzyme [Ostreiculturibacter nitratireducens]|uniref:D-TA family PLP-dependent enzyme n=1 Tax=Ostreiculturibacter nitratireducens TaxID=3075226 RepID=UPI0031B57FF1